MSELSSRVMNMKFMQKNGSTSKEEIQIKKIKDTSEWSLPSSAKILSTTRPITVVETVGYANINAFTSSSSPASSTASSETAEKSVRRVWGAPKPVEQEGQQDEDGGLNISKLKDSMSKPPKKKPSVSNSDEQSKEFLRNLWDKSSSDETKSTKRKGDYVPNTKIKQQKKK